MIQGITKRPIQLKNGNRLEAGAHVSLYWPDAHRKPGLVEVCAPEISFGIPASSGLRLIGILITEDQLGDAICDGTCETPAGNRVEPDGVDHEGVPSWLRIYGLI